MTGARAAYDRWHAALDVDAAADTPWHRLVLAHLDPERDLAGRRVLEIAAGRGGFAARLAGSDPAPRVVVAADFSAAAVRQGAAFGRRRSLAGLRWHVADAACLPHPERAFDTVVSCETIEHVPDPAAAVREFARVLVAGGRLFLTTPNYFGGYGLYRWYRDLTGRPFTEEGQPINHVTSWFRTRRWVRDAGLHPVRHDGTGHYLMIPGRAPRRLPWLDRARPLTRWTAVHALIVAEKR